jgi:DNA-binding CsgD family transcriptional regulator
MSSRFERAFELYKHLRETSDDLGLLRVSGALDYHLVRVCADLGDLARAECDVPKFRRQTLEILGRSIRLEVAGFFSSSELGGSPGGEAPLAVAEVWDERTVTSRAEHYNAEVLQGAGLSVFLAPRTRWLEAVEMLEERHLETLDIYRESIEPYRLRACYTRHWAHGATMFGLVVGRRGALSQRALLSLDVMLPIIQVGEQLARHRTRRPGFPREPLGLPPRQAQIAALVARGLRNAEIAALLGVSKLTVRNHLVEIFRKTGVSTRAELAARVAAEG